MKIINTGNIYRIYDDNLKTFEGLPINTYKVCFSKMTGFFLELAPDIEIKEKIYGIHEKKVDKIMNSFKMFERNLGVILSGDKGIGKSICAKLIAQKALKQGLPVILVTEYVPGIADYISSITQETVVIFDEFDKTFNCEGRDYIGHDNESPKDNDCQAEMLTLFDGLDQGKKLFVVTCNKLTNLNEFLVNRPGRFHYHLRFDYPTADEIREYLTDKLDNKYYDQIDDVVSFAGNVNINYDCLRSIAFELSLGQPFKEAIKDLNIVNFDACDEYACTIFFEDGSKTSIKRVHIDFYYEYEDDFNLSFNDGQIRYEVLFDPDNGVYDTSKNLTIVEGKYINSYNVWERSSGNDIENPKKIKCLAFKRKAIRSIHYDI